MSYSSEKNLIRFACPACGTRLVVDSALGGLERPCQSCGALIVIPPLEVSMSLSEKRAAPVAVQPRTLAKKRVSSSRLDAPSRGGSNASRGDGHDGLEVMPVTKPVPYKKSAMRARSVSPASVLSHAHEQKKNTKALIVMALVICLVVCFTLGVYYYLVYGSFQ